jgi:hypothetical protein
MQLSNCYDSLKHSRRKDGISKIYLIKQELGDEAVAFMKVVCQALQIDSSYILEYENAKESKIGHLRPIF